MKRLFAGNHKAAVAAGSAIVLALLMIAAIAEGDPTRAHTRALLRLRAGRDVTILIIGGSVNPFVEPADNDNKAPYAWFVGYLRHAFPEANISVVRSLWGDATARELHGLTGPVLRAVKPDVTILCLGASDYKLATPPDAYDAASAALTKSVKSLGGFTIVAGAILPQVEAARPVHIHTRRNALNTGCVYVGFDAILRQSRLPIGALLRDERRLTAKGAVLLANGLIRAWCRPVAENKNPLPEIHMKIQEGESSLGGYVRVDTRVQSHGDTAFIGDVTIFFGGAAERRQVIAVPGQALITPWILRVPVGLPRGRSAVTPMTMQVKDRAERTRCRMRYVVIAPAIFVDTRSPPPQPRGPERFHLGPGNLVFGKYGGASDIDAEVEVKGDAAALYVTAVVDDQIVVREAADSLKPGDRIEILLDLRRRRQAETNGTGEGVSGELRHYGNRQGDPLPGHKVYRLILTPPTVDGTPAFRVESLRTREIDHAGEKRPKAAERADDRESEIKGKRQGAAEQAPDESNGSKNQEALQALREAEVSSSITPTGYRIVARIPWASLGAAAGGRPMRSFGFDLVVQDIDGPMLPRTRLVLFGTDPPDPSLFGAITHTGRYREGMVRVIAP